MQKLLNEFHAAISPEAISAPVAFDAEALATAAAEKLVCSVGEFALDVKESNDVAAETALVESERPRRRIFQEALRWKWRVWHRRQERQRARSAADIVNKPPEAKPYRRSPMTRRELEVLEEMVLGLTNQKIADRFGISRRTVETHRTHIKKKLGARNTADIVRIVLIGDNADRLREKLQLSSHPGVRIELTT